MPVDLVTATLILHDGDRSEIILFMPPGEDMARLVSEGDRFLPVTRAGKVCLVARSAIACLGVTPRVARPDDLPVERQAAIVRLESGTVLEGELRWIAPEGKQRTADFLNGASPYIEVFTAALTYYVLKAHIATVQEA
jgi:hypothetical protein